MAFDIVKTTLFKYIPDGDETQVMVPEGIISIGKYAFEGCKKLKSVQLPGSIGSIGSYAFKDCANLAEFVIPEVICELDGTFKGCKKLKNIVLPANVQIVSGDLFTGCDKLRYIEAPGDIYFGTMQEMKEKIASGCNETMTSKAILLSEMMRTRAFPVYLPDVMPEKLPANLKKAACYGFAMAVADGKKIPVETDAAYRAVLRQDKARYLPDCTAHEGMTELLLEEGLIKPDKVEQLIETARRNKNKAAEKKLTQYKQNLLTDSEKGKADAKAEKLRKERKERLAAAERGEGGLSFAVDIDFDSSFGRWGRNFCDKKELEAFLRQRGMKLVASMSSKTDFLVVGNAAKGSDKMKKAQTLGIPFITEEKLLDAVWPVMDAAE